jgi:heme A synthase
VPKLLLLGCLVVEDLPLVSKLLEPKPEPVALVLFGLVFFVVAVGLVEVFLKLPVVRKEFLFFTAGGGVL